MEINTHTHKQLSLTVTRLTEKNACFLWIFIHSRQHRQKDRPSYLKSRYILVRKSKPKITSYQMSKWDFLETDGPSECYTGSCSLV